MEAEADDVLRGIILDDYEYKVEQSLFRNKYKAYDSRGDLVLQGRQKHLKLKEEFPFLDHNDEPVFTVKAESVMDTAGNYTLFDEVTGDPVVVLDKNWSFTHHIWKIRDPRTEALIATIESESTLVSVLRNVSSIFALIPHKYEITDMDDYHVGSIEGQFSLKDEYTVKIDDTTAVPGEAVVAAAMVIDAIEGN